jgi:hypothetical protein
MSFLSSLLSILIQFFKSGIGIFEADLNYEMGWLGLNVSLLMYSWASAMSGYGPLIPAILVAVVGVTISGLLVVFVFFDSARDLVGA